MRKKRKRNKQMALINILLKFIRQIEVGSYLFQKKNKNNRKFLVVAKKLKQTGEIYSLTLLLKKK